MPSVTLNFTVAVGNRIGNAFEAAFGLADGETQTQLVRRKITEFVRGVVAGHEAQVAARVAHDAAKADAEAGTVIT